MVACEPLPPGHERALSRGLAAAAAAAAAAALRPVQVAWHQHHIER
eukprot:CAMPEP_0178417468 /NCGR_PEP_ID=MMETSP0689_2-20121128/24589_1 /TAXON_ID=160604 /ORGANISM="Amphidinium massartii, Strain CS-259" /LENGTH=45 /DNA_ID= /DNA_START= /DNA_END= /DNA_ORIENTATION=